MTSAFVSPQPLGARIPRNIHQIYTGGALPPALRANVEALRDGNPAWRHTLYADADIRTFILTEYGREVFALYDRIAAGYGAARADLFRYLLMYRVGGVYLDVKSRFLVPIDEVVRGDEGYILSHWRNAPGAPHEGWGLHDALAHVPGGEFQQWHVIAAPGHPFLHAVIERVLGQIAHYSVRRNDVGWTGVLGVTGPIPYTLAIAPLLDRYPCRVVVDETTLKLEYNVLGGSAHKSLGGRHYTELLHPVVRQPGPRGWADRAHVALRAYRKRWRA